MRSLSSDKKSFDLSRGDLGKVLLVEIIGAAYVHKVTGRLDIVRGNLIKRIYFFKSLPTYVTSTAPSESLLEVAGQTRWLRPDDILQLRSMQAEMDLSTEELFKALELLDNSEIYALQVETFMQMILEACSCQEGKYEMHFGDDMIAEAPFFDLNPLDIIYQGIKAYKPLDLGEELQQIQHKKARLNHGREKIVTLPEIYYERSDVLDIFENEMTISDSIPRLYQEFGDLTESMLFLYLLLVTGLLQIIENPAPEQRGTSTYIFGREGQPESAPSNKLSDGTVYIHTLKKRQTSLETPPERPVVEKPKKPEPEPTAPPSALEAPPPVFEAPSFVPEAALTVPETPSFAPEALAPEPFEQAEPPPPVPDDDWGDTVPGVPPATKEVLPEHEVRPKAESLPEIEIVKGGSVQLKTPAVNKKDLAETRARLDELEKELGHVSSHFEVLGIDEQSDILDAQEAFDKLMLEASLDHLPMQFQDSLREQSRRITDKLQEAFEVLIDPDERIAHEMMLFDKKRKRATRVTVKENLAMMMFNRGNWYMDTANRPELARRCYQMAIEMNPKQPLFYAYVGWACYRKSDQGTNLAEAMDYLNQALEINVNHDEAHYFLGIIYKRQRNEEKAIHHFREVLRINPDHVQAKRESYLMESHTKKKKSLFGRMFGKNSRPIKYSRSIKREMSPWPRSL